MQPLGNVRNFWPLNILYRSQKMANFWSYDMKRYIVTRKIAFKLLFYLKKTAPNAKT